MFRRFVTGLAILAIFSQVAFAQVAAPSLLKKTGTALSPINSAWTWGDSTHKHDATFANLTADSIASSTPSSFPDGSCGSPSITNTGDTDTGFLFPAANTIGLTANGACIGTWTTGNLSFDASDLSWSAGVAVTAARYSVSRDADATNQLHFNVPTGATFEFSVNDVPEATLSSTAVNFQNNSITTTGGGSLTGTWSDLGTVSTIDINGGTLDGVTIGGASPSTGTFTTLFVGDGSAAAPSYSFGNDTNTGGFRKAADTFALAGGGTELLNITKDGSGNTVISNSAATAGDLYLSLKGNSNEVIVGNASNANHGMSFLTSSSSSGSGGFFWRTGAGLTLTSRLVGDYTSGQMAWGIGSSHGNQLVLSTLANVAKDNDIVAQTNPVLSASSSLDPDTDNGERINLSYLGLRAGNVSNADFSSSTFAMQTDRATYDTTISAVNAYQGSTSATNPNGGALLLMGGNATSGHLTAGNGGSIKMIPGKRGAFGDGAVEFYDNATDLTQYGSIRRNNNDSSWFFDSLSSSGLVSIGYSSSGTFYSSFKVQNISTAVNYIQAQGSSTGNYPSVTAQGSDSNIELRLAGKGTKPVNIIKSATTGNTQLFTVTASSTTGSTGSSSISDIVFDLSPTRTWDTDAVSQQRDIVFQGRTHAASGAKPVSELYTLSLVAPTDSTNFNVSGTVAALETQATPVNRATGSAAGINIKLPTVANGIGNVGQMGGLFITANGGGAVSLGDTAGTVSAYAGIAIPQFTVEAGAAKTASLLAGIAAFAPVAGTNVTATPYAYYGSGRSLFTEPTTTFVADSEILDIKRTGNLTATAASFFSDLNIAPIFTLTEPSSSSVIYAGLNIDMSQVSVTAGTGTSVITSLYLAANADPDAGSAYALYADGQGFFSGNFTVDGTTTLNTALTGVLRADAGVVSVDSTVAAGTWTPTLTNVANLDGSTAFQCQYSRVGATVTGSCRFSVDPTAAAGTTTQLGFTLPVASNFGAIEDAAGSCSSSGVAGQSAAVIADTTNDRMEMNWKSGDTTDQPMTCSFSYQVI